MKTSILCSLLSLLMTVIVLLTNHAIYQGGYPENWCNRLERLIFARGFCWYKKLEVDSCAAILISGKGFQTCFKGGIFQSERDSKPFRRFQTLPSLLFGVFTWCWKWFNVENRRRKFSVFAYIKVGVFFCEIRTRTTKTWRSRAQRAEKRFSTPLEWTSKTLYFGVIFTLYFIFMFYFPVVSLPRRIRCNSISYSNV